MREFINIMDEAEMPIDINEQAHDAAMSAIYNAKANPTTHGHYNVFWYVDTSGTDQVDMVRIVDLLELGLLIIGNHKSWRKTAQHVIVFPFHEPLSEDRVLKLLTDTILKRSKVEEPDGSKEEDAITVKEGKRSIRSMLENALSQK